MEDDATTPVTIDDVAGADTNGQKSPPGRSIVVNGRTCRVQSSDVGFVQLVRLAFAGEEPSDSRALSVTYRRGPVSATEGILAPRQRTLIADGETFIVTRTDRP